MNAIGQDLDLGLEAMWSMSSQGINAIDPGKCHTGPQPLQKKPKGAKLTIYLEI